MDGCGVAAAVCGLQTTDWWCNPPEAEAGGSWDPHPPCCARCAWVVVFDDDDLMVSKTRQARKVFGLWRASL